MSDEESKNVSKQELDRRLTAILVAIGATEGEVSSGRLTYESVGKAGTPAPQLDAWDSPAVEKGSADDGQWPRDLAAASDEKDVEKPCGAKRPQDDEDRRRR